MEIESSIRDNIAVLTLHFLPANGLGAGLRKSLSDALQAAEDHPAIAGIVITGNPVEQELLAPLTPKPTRARWPTAFLYHSGPAA
ncbi:hypothetical protein H0A64_07315 [Alcaligenaceae bacterium]|nr:hypothetical protein [Alcaligenaceae bacterium]